MSCQLVSRTPFLLSLASNTILGMSEAQIRLQLKEEDEEQEEDEDGSGHRVTVSSMVIELLDIEEQQYVIDLY